MTPLTVRVGSLQIRHGREGDIDQLNSSLAACIEAMRADGIDQWDDVYPNPSSLVSDIQSDTLYVATLVCRHPCRSHHCGFIRILNDRQEPEYFGVEWAIRGVPVAVVHRLMVRPDYQRSGVARLLMRFAEKRALELDFGAIRLDAFMANPGALRLYASLGYQAVGMVIFRKGPFQCFGKALKISQIDPGL